MPERLQRLIRELGLERNVVLTGELADPKPACAAMEAFVLPSTQPEPFGGVVMEAIIGRKQEIAVSATGRRVSLNRRLPAMRARFLSRLLRRGGWAGAVWG